MKHHSLKKRITYNKEIIEKLFNTHTLAIRIPLRPSFVYHHYSVPTILQVVTRICFRKKLFYYRF